MAAYSLKKLVPVTTLGTSATTLYTVTAPVVRGVVKQLLIANYSGSSATVSIHFVPSGGTASNSNIVVPTFSVAAASTVTLDITQVLNQGEFIAGLASASASINITASGFEEQ